MTPLQRVILTNLRVRLLVQVPVFIAYAVLSRGLSSPATPKGQQSCQ